MRDLLTLHFLIDKIVVAITSQDLSCSFSSSGSGRYENKSRYDLEDRCIFHKHHPHKKGSKHGRVPVHAQSHPEMGILSILETSRDEAVPQRFPKFTKWEVVVLGSF